MQQNLVSHGLLPEHVQLIHQDNKASKETLSINIKLGPTSHSLPCSDVVIRLGLAIIISIAGAATISIADESMGRMPLLTNTENVTSSKHTTMRNYRSPVIMARALAIPGAVLVPVGGIPHTNELLGDKV